MSGVSFFVYQTTEMELHEYVLEKRFISCDKLFIERRWVTMISLLNNNFILRKKTFETLNNFLFILRTSRPSTDNVHSFLPFFIQPVLFHHWLVS